MLDITTIETIASIINKITTISTYKLDNLSENEIILGTDWTTMKINNDSDENKNIIIDVPELRNTGYYIILIIEKDSYDDVTNIPRVKLGKGKTVTKTVFEVELD